MNSINSTSPLKSSKVDFIITQRGTINIKIASLIFILLTFTKVKIKYKAAKGAKVKGYDSGLNGEKCNKNTDEKIKKTTELLLYFLFFVYR
jgi:hypothetical protein